MSIEKEVKRLKLCENLFLNYLVLREKSLDHYKNLIEMSKKAVLLIF